MHLIHLAKCLGEGQIVWVKAKVTLHTVVLSEHCGNTQADRTSAAVMRSTERKKIAAASDKIRRICCTIAVEYCISTRRINYQIKMGVVPLRHDAKRS